MCVHAVLRKTAAGFCGCKTTICVMRQHLQQLHTQTVVMRWRMLTLAFSRLRGSAGAEGGLRGGCSGRSPLITCECQQKEAELLTVGIQDCYTCAHPEEGGLANGPSEIRQMTCISARKAHLKTARLISLANYPVRCISPKMLIFPHHPLPQPCPGGGGCGEE